MELMPRSFGAVCHSDPIAIGWNEGSLKIEI
jgi:hypothetical protein